MLRLKLQESNITAIGILVMSLALYSLAVAFLYMVATHTSVPPMVAVITSRSAGTVLYTYLIFSFLTYWSGRAKVQNST